MNEEFIDIKDYEGLYKINKKGEILGVKYNKILKPEMHKGYLRVNLSKNGKTKHFFIHRLLGIHFIDNPDNLPEIDHINRNKLNNNIENLRWCTHSDNNKNKNIKGYINKHFNKQERIYYSVYVRCKYKANFKTYDEASEFLKKYLEENEN